MPRSTLYLIIGLVQLGLGVSAQADVRQQVVRISAQKSMGEEIGAGLLVGQHDNRLYVLTAYHVVAEAITENMEVVDEVVVQLYNRDLPVKASVLHQDQELDIAVLMLPLAEPLSIEPIIPADALQLREEAKVVVIGHPGGAFWRKNELNFIQETALYEDDRLFSITPQGIVGGHSGGPVLMGNGAWLGIVTETSLVEARGVRVQVLKAWLTAHQVPHNFIFHPTPDLVLLKSGDKRARTDFIADDGTMRWLSQEEYEMSYYKLDSADLTDFYMGRKEVTVAEFRNFVIATGYTTEIERGGTALALKDGWVTFFERINWRHDATGKVLSRAQGNLPVTYVSFTDAKAYCEWLSRITGERYRLPLLEEWAYAFFPKKEPAIRKAYFKDNIDFDQIDNPDGFVTTAPVGTFPPNEWGLYNMYGNVSEWCFNSYGYFNDPNSLANTYYHPYQRPNVERAMGPNWYNFYYHEADDRVYCDETIIVSYGGDYSTDHYYYELMSDGGPVQATCFTGFRVVKEVTTAEDSTVKRLIEQVRTAHPAVGEEEDPAVRVKRQEAVIEAYETIHHKYPTNRFIRKELSAEYGNLSFYYLFTKQFTAAETAARKGLKLYPLHTWIYTNLAPALLYQGKWEKAKALYSELEDRMWLSTSDTYPFGYPFSSTTYRQAFLEDISALEDRGITHPDVPKLKELLVGY